MSTTKQSSNKASSKSFGYYLKTAFTLRGKPSNDDALEIMFVARQILGIVLGIAAGVFKLEGVAIILTFFILNFLFVFVYAEKFLGLDPTKFEENELYVEAFGLSIMEFLFTWTVTYTFL